jgi:CHAT domain-containing protein
VVSTATFSRFGFLDGGGLPADPVERLDALKARLEASSPRKASLRIRVDLGVAYAALGNYPRALDHLGAAVEGLHGEVRGERAAAHALAQIGLVHLRRAEYGPALDALERAAHTLGERGAHAARSYVRALLGNVYAEMGDLDRARSLYDEALALRPREKGGDTGTGTGTDTGSDTASERNQSVEEGDLLGNLGSMHFLLGNNEEAVAHFERARAIFEKHGDGEGVANALFGIGRVRKLQGGYRTALEIHGKALALQPPGSAAAARSRCAIAETHLSMGDTDAALGELKRAMEGADGAARIVQVEILVVWALAELERKEADAAAELIRRALDLLLEVTGGLADEHVVGVRERRGWIFDTGIAVALRTGRVDLATEFIEHGRAGALLEGIGGRAARRGLPSDLLEASARAAHRLAQADRDYQRARAARRLKDLRAATAALEATKIEYRTVQQRIQRGAKRLASVYHPVPDTLAAIRHQLATGDVLVLYALLPFHAHAVVVTRMAARVVWLGNTADLRASCEAFAAIGRNEEKASGDADVVWQRLAGLERMLLDPLELPKGAKRLLVSPDGPLCYVPFPLLLERRDPDLEVACLPSGTTLGLLAEERERTGTHVVAVGDPDYTIEHEGHSLQVYAGGVALEPLPATRDEVRSITGKDDLRLLGSYATVGGLAEAAASRARWNVLHIACHGLIDPRTPTLSALALTPDAHDDGFLTALEVYGMSLPADLVVLSGCNTGRGRFAKGEGIVGLMRAFMCAGSPRIVVSLWKVDDAATQALMTRFHRLWRGEGLPTALALRRAQQEIRRDPRWMHPRYWGAWVLWGLPD